MFIERLSEISNRIDGALALSLVAEDGITVESVSSSPELELDLLAAELITQVKAIAENHRDLAAGEVRQLTVATERMTLMVSSVSDSYYLVLVLAGDGNHGRARFELRRARLALEGDLA
ncbi:MAG TPA: roadblock/LC7 domain-containing protein [Thermoanaerobaculia bacterium]|nr:roadblock/LC7 domain-containing protein [Thermoanaerobaculia bacterium]